MNKTCIVWYRVPPVDILYNKHVIATQYESMRHLPFQCSQPERQVVRRSQAWCNMIGVPYFRFSPPLSEDVPLDCTDDMTLINMLWETQCYIHQNEEKLKELAGHLVC